MNFTFTRRVRIKQVDQNSLNQFFQRRSPITRPSSHHGLSRLWWA